MKHIKTFEEFLNESVNTSIPSNIQNIMRRTKPQNNRDFWKDAPKYMKQSNIDKKNIEAIWDFMDKNSIEYKDINDKWYELYKDQEKQNLKYKK